MRVADFLVKECVQNGITNAFVVTGGGAMHLNDALFKNLNIHKFFFHHEQAAAIAAEGYARITNTPVLLNVTTGPGGVNALNGVYGAYVDSLPMIVISGQVKRSTMINAANTLIRQLGDQEVDIISMVKKITKYCCVLDNADDTLSIIRKAIYIAKNGRPGPVWIDVPIDIQSTELAEAGIRNNLISYGVISSDKNLNPSAVQEFQLEDISTLRKKIHLLIEKFNRSSKPVILVGNGLHCAGVENELLKLANILNAPIVTGWGAHDLISDDHPSYVGRPGTVGDRAGNFAVQGADFLLVLGCRLNIRQISYGWQSFAKNAWKTMVDIDKNEIEKATLKIENKIHVDLKSFFKEFFKLASRVKRSSKHEAYLKICKNRQKIYPVFHIGMMSKESINPYHFFDSLFRILEKDSTIVCGNGSACVMSFQVAQIKMGQRMFTNSGAASMGYDLPAAIGASIALGNSRAVICIAGDGSLMMNLQELQTIVFNKMNLKIIIINNNGYSSIKQTQRNYFPERIFGVDASSGLGFPDFQRIARAFDIEAKKLANVCEIDSQINWLLSGSAPKLLEVLVDETQDFEPKLRSRILENGEMRTPELDDMFPFLSDKDLAAARM